MEVTLSRKGLLVWRGDGDTLGLQRERHGERGTITLLRAFPPDSEPHQELPSVCLQCKQVQLQQQQQQRLRFWRQWACGSGARCRQRMPHLAGDARLVGWPLEMDGKDVLHAAGAELEPFVHDCLLLASAALLAAIGVHTTRAVLRECTKGVLLLAACTVTFALQCVRWVQDSSGGGVTCGWG